MGILRAACRRAQICCQHDDDAGTKMIEVLKKTVSVNSRMLTTIQKHAKELQKAAEKTCLINQDVKGLQEMVEKKLRLDTETLGNYEARLKTERERLAASEKKHSVCKELHQKSTDHLVEERHRLMLFLGLVPGRSQAGVKLSLKFIDRKDPQREFQFVIRRDEITGVSPPIPGVDEIAKQLKEKRVTLVEAICLMRAAFRKSVEKQ